MLYIIRRKVRNPRWVKSTPVICARLVHLCLERGEVFRIYLTDAPFWIFEETLRRRIIWMAPSLGRFWSDWRGLLSLCVSSNQMWQSCAIERTPRSICWPLVTNPLRQESVPAAKTGRRGEFSRAAELKEMDDFFIRGRSFLQGPTHLWTFFSAWNWPVCYFTAKSLTAVFWLVPNPSEIYETGGCTSDEY